MKRKIKKIFNKSGGTLVITDLVIWTIIIILFIKPLILKGYPLYNDVALLLFFIGGLILFIIIVISTVIFLFGQNKRYFSPRRKRKIAKFFLVKLAILITPPTVIAFLQPNILHGEYKDGQLWWIGITLLISIALLLIFNFVSKPSIHHFETIDFGDNNDTTIEQAIEGIINAEKARPKFVYAAPISDKAARDACSIITKSGTAKTFYYITGRPGEGKSMYAYHLSYLLSKKGYNVYLLTLTCDIVGCLEEIKRELDYLKGSKKIIIIDEAHNLEGIAKRLFIQSLCENADFINQVADSKNLNEIICWINTEFFEERMHITNKDSENLDVQKFLPKLIAEFYLSEILSIRNKLIKKIDGLEEAINLFQGVKDISFIKEKFPQLNDSSFKTALYSYFNNEIEEPWTFNFIASGAEIKLVEELKYLTSAQKFVLFFISAKVVISGNRELSFNQLSYNLSSIKSHLYSYNEASLNEIIKELQTNLNETEHKHKKFISVSPKKANTTDYVSAHHYNTAKVLIEAIIKSMPGEESELLKAASFFLSGEKEELKFFGIFHIQIGQWASQFDNDYKHLLQEFFNQPMLGNGVVYQRLLESIKKVATNVFLEICKNIDGEAWAQLIRRANVNQFQTIANFLNSLKSLRGKVIQNLSPDDYKNLADKIGKATIENFKKAGDLMNSFGTSKSELIKNFSPDDYKNLADKIGKATIENFSQAESLINSLDSSKSKLIKNFSPDDYKNLADKIGKATIENFSQAGDLMNSFGTSKSELVKHLEMIDVTKLIGQINSHSLNQIELLYQFLSATENFGINLLAQINIQQIILKLNQYNKFNVSILMGLTSVISLMKEDQRNEFISQIDWERIYFLLPVSNQYIHYHGYILSNLIHSCSNDLESPPVKKVKVYISSQINLYASEILKIHISQFKGLARFLYSCNKLDNAIAIQLTKDPFFQILLNKTFISPKNFGDIAYIINSIRQIDSVQALEYIKNYKIQKFIPQSFNSVEWHNSKNTNLAKYEKEKKESFQLVKAIFKTSKEEWLKMRNKLDCRK